MGQEEALIGATQFILLPLTFLSTTFLAANIMPGWIAHVADFNPVNWAVVAGRSAVSSSADWADRRARRVPGGAAGAVGGVRDQGVPVVSAVGLGAASAASVGLFRRASLPGGWSLIPRWSSADRVFNGGHLERGRAGLPARGGSQSMHNLPLERSLRDHGRLCMWGMRGTPRSGRSEVHWQGPHACCAPRSVPGTTSILLQVPAVQPTGGLDRDSGATPQGMGMPAERPRTLSASEARRDPGPTLVDMVPPPPPGPPADSRRARPPWPRCRRRGRSVRAGSPATISAIAGRSAWHRVAREAVQPAELATIPAATRWANRATIDCPVQHIHQIAQEQHPARGRGAAISAPGPNRRSGGARCGGASLAPTARNVAPQRDHGQDPSSTRSA